MQSVADFQVGRVINSNSPFGESASETQAKAFESILKHPKENLKAS